ncbi:amidohydrolase [Saliphagus sp. LR7]|uniref:amidohydrolase n=1 Tax=Saliphagus sp. LR7 TaxID=2282654 RepID=UPI000DF7DCE6|nr:amidohydrolase [Saliphagus sp. LR7]
MNGDSLALSGGTVYTLAGSPTEEPTADGIVFRDGRVADLAGGTAERTIDLEGRTVLPGFVDAHAHLPWVGIALHETDLSAADDREEALAALAENAADTAAGDWVLGFGYDESTWPAGQDDPLTRGELDGVSETHPIAAKRVDGHAVSLNATGLERVDLDGVDDDVRREGGEATGVVVEDAVIRVTEATYPDRGKARTVLEKGARRAAELGITTVYDMAGMATPNEPGDPFHAALFSAWREDALPVRVGYYVHIDRGDALADLEIASGFGDDRLSILGLKVFSDGSIGAQSAKLDGEFADDPGNDGQFVIDRDRLREAFAAAARANQSIATHAIGTEAIEVVLDAYEEVLPAYETDDPRLRIEHAELATDDQIERMAELDVIASMQPNFLQWSAPGGLYEARLGERWRRENNRLRRMHEAGVRLALGSDTMPFGPLYGIHHAVNAPHDAQRLSVGEALRAYTRGGAYAGFADERGSLEPGKLADAVVLDRDPFEHPEEIDEIEVVATVVGGEIVYEAPDPGLETTG